MRHKLIYTCIFLNGTNVSHIGFRYRTLWYWDFYWNETSYKQIV